MDWCSHCGANLTPASPLAFGNVTIVGDGTIILNDHAIELSRTLYSIAESIIGGRGRGLTCGLLASRLEADIFDGSIIKYVERLRASFREVDPQFDQIETLRGFGAYRWRFKAPKSGSARPGVRLSASSAVSLAAH